MKKIAIGFLLGLFTLGTITACEEVNNTEYKTGCFETEYVDGFEIITDKETGVQYLESNGMCPRYNADGTLYIKGE